MADKKYKNESDFQKDVMKWLRSKGCTVWKLPPGGGIPTGVPDVLFMFEGFYGFLECKKAKNSPHRPGQDKWVEKLNAMSYARFCYPSNWAEIQKELTEMLK